MSQRVFITNKPEGSGAASDSRSHKPRPFGGSSLARPNLPKGRGKPKIVGGLRWRKDGECGQIIILSKEDFALPLILNFSAARIFLLCNGRNSLEGIAQLLSEEFKREDYAKILDDVKRQVGYFLDRGIVEV